MEHRAWSIEPGETPIVLASTLTFIGGVTPIVFQGATPVFIDADRVSWNMDPDLLEEELERCAKAGKLPKAVVPTDLYGQCCDYKRILEICGEYGVPVVADAAEALGAEYKWSVVSGQIVRKTKGQQRRMIGGMDGWRKNPKSDTK